VKRLAWCWLAVLVFPGCLLVQPLDEAKPDLDASGGDTASAGKTNGGGGRGGAGPGPTAGSHSGGASAAGGAAHAGASATGGAPTGTDFSLFLGAWTVTSGTITTDCGTGPMQTAADVGTKETIGLGTTSDLIVDEGTQCPVLVDVTGTVAFGQDGQTCDFSDASGAYHLEINSYDFAVGSTGTTASAELISTVELTANGTTTTCDSDELLVYKR
jgi:hypothetical protein